MNCPKCRYSNPQGVTYCQMCYEVLNRSASFNIHHAIKQKKQKEEEATARPLADDPTVAAVREFLQQIDWNALSLFFKGLFHQYRKGFASVALGAAALGYLVYVLSPHTQHRLTGTRLEHHFSAKTPATYLVGFHTESKNWSERQGQLDTPLENIQSDETGSVKIEVIARSRKTKTIKVHAREWINTEQTSHGRVTTTIVSTHPSLKAATVTLDKGGFVMERQNPLSLRLGRCLDFVLPRWPKGRHRRGDRWNEPVEWVEALGSWKIFWKGEFHWTLEDYETYDQVACAHLSYRAELTPHVWAAPPWAQGGIQGIRFSGQGKGDAYFDHKVSRLFANTFSYEGTLTLPITNVGRIPRKQRIGRKVAEVPGDIMIQFKNKVEIRKL